MSLSKVLIPKSVAVVGASKTPTKRGFQAIRTMLEDRYEGEIFPVNPKEDVILGLKCYSKISEIEAPVDLALITTPAATIPGVLEDCGKKGVSGAVIIAGGFRETGEKGRELESRMVETARRNNIRLIGPNTSGMMSLNSNLNLVGLRDTPKGEIALLSQSGNMALSIITEARVKSRKGFAYYVGVGNEADIKFHEYLAFFRDDPRTRTILMYVEGLQEGRTFLQEAYQTTLKKPIVLLKGGRSSTGQRSAGSHTGALAGMSEVAMGAFKRAGIITIENPDELFPVAETLSSLPPLKNNRIAVLADGGGHATIISDILTDLGMEIPPLSESTQAKLRKILPSNASVGNPVDVAGGTDSDPTVFADCAEILMKDREIGGLLIVGLFGGYSIRFDESLAYAEEDAAHRIGKMAMAKKKPIVVHSLYSFARPHSLDLLRYYNVPVYDSLDIAGKCMGVLAEYGQYLTSYHTKAKFVMEYGKKAQPTAVRMFEKAREQGRKALLEPEARAVLREHGIGIPVEGLAMDADQAVEFASGMNGPVVLKIVSPDILHKSDAGGVKINLKGDDQVREAFNRIMENARAYDPKADIRGVMVAPMASPGVETIIGTKIDDQFGPVIMFGVGGILVEVLKDVSFRVLPISHVGAREMIKDIKSYRVLDGYRGTPKCDKKALAKLLVTISEIVEAYPQIREMDLNPVIVGEYGVNIADARIILKD